MNFLKFLGFVALGAFCASNAAAETLSENPLSIPAMAVVPGEETELVMNYNTTEQYIGFQFELYLPDGVTFVMDPDDEN